MNSREQTAADQFTRWWIGFGSAGILLISGIAFIATGCSSGPKSLTPIPGGGSSASAYGISSGEIMDASSFAVPGAPDGAGPVVFDDSSDELWIVSRSVSNSGPVTGDERDSPPGCGALILDTEESDKIVPLPLQHTDVDASVTAYISKVVVRQTFHNPFSGKIEAKYLFPLPQDAAVNEFMMIIGDRQIRGIIREREEAEEIYRQARAQGRVVSLLTQERPNIFTQSVANIEPGKSIDVSITYLSTLPFRDGWYEFVFPMVVGPRYNPPGTTNGVGAVARGASGRSDKGSEVSYLAPTERSGHDIEVALNIDAGVAVEEFNSPSHVVRVEQSGAGTLSVALGELDRIPNKDFVFRYRVTGDQLKTNFVKHEDERGGFFTFMVYPPAELKELAQQPIEMVFVLDCSGSMNGEPIAQAKSAIRRALTQMRPEDAFQIIRFSERASALGEEPVAATAGNVRRALQYLGSLESGGGTRAVEGVRAALSFPHDPDRLRFVVFMTDGYIGNEMEVFREVQSRLGDARVFSFGVGNAPNGYLLDGLARLGNGAVAYLGLNDDAGRIMDKFVQRIHHPALLDVSVDWSGADVADVYPKSLPDIFLGRPLVVAGRFQGKLPELISVRGRVGGNGITVPLMTVSPTGEPHPELAAIWARRKIADLSDLQVAGKDPTLATQIKQLALDYGIMCDYTAFVAVDALSQTGMNQPTLVEQAVPVPEGVDPETTVGGQ